jgi:hypothetical protein
MRPNPDATVLGRFYATPIKSPRARLELPWVQPRLYWARTERDAVLALEPFDAPFHPPLRYTDYSFLRVFIPSPPPLPRGLAT